MKNIYLISLALIMAGLLFAAPLRNLPLDFTQPDGSPVRVYATGDEFHNWLHDAANFSIVKNADGWYVYARQDGEGVAPTDLIVGRDNPASRNLQPGINLSQASIEAKYARYANTMRDYSNGRSPHMGQFNNLVIFIKFANDPQFSGPISQYDAMFNNTENNANSMKNYFAAASYNQLSVDTSFYPAPEGQTIISYTDINPRNYYRVYSSSNPIGYPADDDDERTQREMQMLGRAVAAVGSQIPASLVIDGDNDGYVDNTCFIIQGGPDGWAELLWPHRWVLYAVTAQINGARVWDFNFQLELSLYSEGASVLAHEMFHSLGAPDLYRYVNASITPIGAWDIMANNANPPQHMSAWMKHRYGQWLPAPTTITASGTYELSPVASSATNNFYKVASWKPNESYILEYRKPYQAYDGNLPGTGLLVYRQDSRYEGNADGPPDELYIYRPGAANTTTQGSLSGAAFSAQTGHTSITEATLPSGFTGSNLAGGLNVYDIGYAGDTISFSIKISDIQLASPVGSEVWFSGTNKNITWKAKTATGNVKLEYSNNLGQNWMEIVANAPNNGSFLWTMIPTMDSPQCQIRITMLTGGQWDSSTKPFSIISTLATPVASLPANQAVNVPTNPQISWQPVSGASGYQFQLSSDPQFNSFVANIIDHPTSLYQASGLTPFTAYYWRVASIGDIGISPFCADQSFTTGNTSELPSIPALLSPANNAVNVSLTPQFNWDTAYLATGYRVQIALDPYFSSLVADVSNISSTTYTSATLQTYKSYYWRVAAMNVAGISNFSLSRFFKTSDGSASEDNLQPVLVNALHPNYPNPFNPQTTLSFSVKDTSNLVALNIYNTRGQLVRRLYNGIPVSSTMNLVWDGNDEAGQPVSSGIYLYRVHSAEFTQTRKMLLSK